MMRSIDDKHEVAFGRSGKFRIDLDKALGWSQVVFYFLGILNLTRYLSFYYFPSSSVAQFFSHLSTMMYGSALSGLWYGIVASLCLATVVVLGSPVSLVFLKCSKDNVLTSGSRPVFEREGFWKGVELVLLNLHRCHGLLFFLAVSLFVSSGILWVVSSMANPPVLWSLLALLLPVVATGLAASKIKNNFCTNILPYFGAQVGFLSFLAVAVFSHMGIGYHVANWLQACMNDAAMYGPTDATAPFVALTSTVIYLAITSIFFPLASRLGLAYQQALKSIVVARKPVLDSLIQTFSRSTKTLSLKREVSWLGDFGRSVSWITICYVALFAFVGQAYLAFTSQPDSSVCSLVWAIQNWIVASALDANLPDFVVGDPALVLFVASIIAAYGYIPLALTAVNFLPNRKRRRVKFDETGVTSEQNFVKYLTASPHRPWSSLRKVSLDLKGVLLLSFDKFKDLKICVKDADEENLLKLLNTADEKSPYCTFDPDAIKLRKSLRANVGAELIEADRDVDSTIFKTPEQDALLIGGRYRVVKLLSTRPLSAVYLARDEDSRLVVVKQFVTPESSTGGEYWRQALHKEYSLLKDLKLDSVADVLDIVEEEDASYLVLQHLPGQTLREYITKQGPRSARETRIWAKKLAELMVELHSMDPPVIHRDLTPDNIIIDESGALRVIDFGAAHQFMEGVTGTLVGKQCYISPEQLRGKVDTANDIYSYGCVLNFLVTGADPRALKESSPLDEGCNIGESFNQLIKDCTKFDEEERIESFEAISTRLDEIERANERASGGVVSDLVFLAKHQAARAARDRLEREAQVLLERQAEEEALAKKIEELGDAQSKDSDQFLARVSEVIGSTSDKLGGSVQAPDTTATSDIAPVVTPVTLEELLKAKVKEQSEQDTFRFTLCDLAGDLKKVFSTLSMRLLPYQIISAAYIIYMYAVFGAPANTMAFLFSLSGKSKWDDLKAVGSVLSGDLSREFRMERPYFGDPRWIKETGHSWLPVPCLAALFFPLFVLPWMITYHLRQQSKAFSAYLKYKFGVDLHCLFGRFNFLGKRKRAENDIDDGEPLESPGGELLSLRQNIEDRKEPAAFFFSSAFTTAAILMTVLGLPGLIALAIYFSSSLPPFAGFYDGTAWSREFFIIYFYIYSLGWGLSTIFMRSWFTFPLNFVSTEYDVKVYDDLVFKSRYKGWFSSLVYLSTNQVIPWSEVKKIDVTGNLNRDGLLERIESPVAKSILKKFRKLLFLHDSISQQVRNKENILYIDVESGQQNSMPVMIYLDELTDREKCQLFHKIKQSASHIPLSAEVQKALIGSEVLQDQRYTELWFDILGRDLSSGLDELEPQTELSSGKYTVESKLRSGGEAVTYLAKNEEGKTVVLKRFQLAASDNISTFVQSAASFENESALLSQLDHPSIVDLLDFFIDGSSAYLVLEHLEGYTIRDYVAEHGVMEKNKVLAVAEQLCEVLEYLHGKEPPVVHRDFTPDNILIGEDGAVKVIDFSVAEQKQSKKESDCAGKHAYTPPEQFRGDACPQSDVYALGGVMAYLLTGDDPEPLSQIKLGADVDDRLRRIVETATALELEERYSSASWLKAEILDAAGVEREEPIQDNDANEPDSDSDCGDTICDAQPSLVVKLPEEKELAVPRDKGID